MKHAQLQQERRRFVRNEIADRAPVSPLRKTRAMKREFYVIDGYSLGPDSLRHKIYQLENSRGKKGKARELLSQIDFELFEWERQKPLNARKPL